MSATLGKELAEKLHEAARSGDAGRIGKVLDSAGRSGVSSRLLLDWLDANGDSALHIAAHRPDSAEALKTLLREGADIRLVNNNGDTGLHIAAAAGNVAVSQVLIDHGADIRAVNAAGYTALEIAKQRAFADEAQLLLKYGGDRTGAGPGAHPQPAANLKP